MNYWHIQLHPNDRENFNIIQVREILEQRAVIGLGEWSDGEAIINQFTESMAIGDIIAVKQGSAPIALVRVIGEAYFEEEIDDNLDWFHNRRDVEVLDFYEEQYNFTIPQSRGSLSICKNLNAITSRVITNWFRMVSRRTLLEKINLTKKRQGEIKTLWQKYKKDNSKDTLQSDVEELQKQWAEYRDKIIDDSFSLDDYTNRIDSNNATKPGGYFCNFLERTTKTVFGSSKPGNANNFEIKLNSDGKTYTIRKELDPREKQNENSKENASKVFEEDIKPLIKSIVNCPDVFSKISIVENSNYAAKHILRKLAVLDHLYDFLPLQKNEWALSGSGSFPIV